MSHIDHAIPAHATQRSQLGRQTLKEAGHKLTPQRVAIVDLFSHQQGHWSAQDVFGELSGVVPSLSLATVYNCLELLEDLGWLRRLHAHDGQITFELNGPSHHHARCSQCGQILDLKLDEQLLRQLLATSQGLDRFDTQRVDLWLTGLCDACR